MDRIEILFYHNEAGEEPSIGVMINRDYINGSREDLNMWAEECLTAAAAIAKKTEFDDPKGDITSSILVISKTGNGVGFDFMFGDDGIKQGQPNSLPVQMLVQVMSYLNQEISEKRH